MKAYSEKPSGSTIDGGGSGKQSVTARLLKLVAGDEFFHSPQGKGYSSLRAGDHRETYPVRSLGYRAHLRRAFHQEYKAAACASVVEEAVAVLECKALFEGPVFPVYYRVGHVDGKFYLDLCNQDWEAVEVTPDGWTIACQHEVRFCRAPGMLELPRPVKSTDGERKLRTLLNVKSAAHAHLVMAWLLGALRPNGPYPLLGLISEQGSGKTLMARLLRGLVDPNEATVRGAPRDERDLMIAATNGWVIALDNLSCLPDWLSDALCRLSTGGGHGTRRLYSDDEEVLFNVQRPVILTGIEQIVGRADLLDRSIVLDLPQIRPADRKPEQQLLAEFEEHRPAILGWLLETTAGALSAGNLLRPAALPRMADFAAWMAAAEPFLGWEDGAFERAYAGNRGEAHEITLDASPIGRRVLALVPWAGTARQLLLRLNNATTEEEKRDKSWPGSPKTMSDALRRIVPSLHAAGVEVTFEREGGGNRDRIISLRRIQEAGR